jgi:DNA-binding CsgD family transcriptional regulator
MDRGVEWGTEIYVLRGDGTPELSTSGARRSTPAWWDELRRALGSDRHARRWVDGGARTVTLQRLVSVTPELEEPRYLASVQTQPPWVNAAALTRRQLEVAEFAAGGATVAEIGRAVGVSAHTVRSHLKVVYRTLGVGNRVELALALARLPA